MSESVSSRKRRITITAALPYTNGAVHIGHLAGVYVPADVYSRYLKLQGHDALFVCGSDEHGVPITITAEKEHIAPQEVVDKYHHLIKRSFEDFGIAFDFYGRTSGATHHRTAADFFKRLNDDQLFEVKRTAQLYDEKSQRFLADRFVKGICPKCGSEESYGDQCERCGTSHNATDLINPKSAITGATPILKDTKHWYLPLDQYQNFLKEWILVAKKGVWKPNVYGQVKSWIDDGLKPRAVTRDLAWGVPVPLKEGAGKVLYVWFDAPIGYISFTKEWASKNGKDWKKYWQDADTELVHFIGKDNIVFHCVMFPAMLKAAGGYILPKNVPANEFLNLQGKKISTSRHWAVWLHEYLTDFPNAQDVLRYTLTANAPETKDNDFTWEDFQKRNNSELVAIFGNFINRVVVLTNKYHQGFVPACGALTSVDEEVLSFLRAAPEQIGKEIETYHFRNALQEMMKLARVGNKYLADEAPWKLVKTDAERTATILYVASQVAAGLAVLCEPFLPFTAQKLKRMLRLPNVDWQAVSKNAALLPTGHPIGNASLLFDKITDEAIAKQLEKLAAQELRNENKEEITVAPIKPMITFEDFSKMDIRTATILSAKKVPKTKKLLELQVDTGLDKRTVVSGIAAYFSPKDIVGQKVLVLVNLKPRKLRGIESQGMILMSENQEGVLQFVQANEDTPNGSKVS